MQPTRSSNAQPAPTLARLSRVFVVRDASGVSSRYPYTEFRASGSPLEALGLPGDVYLNTKTGSLDLYAKDLTGWKKWPGPENVENTLIHPSCPDRYLWFKRDMSAFGWYQKKSLIHSQSPPSELLSLILKEQSRLADSSAAQKRKKQMNEDLPGNSSPAKKRRLGPSTSDLPDPNSGPQINHRLPISPSLSNSASTVSGPSNYGNIASSSRAAGPTDSFGRSPFVVRPESSVLASPTPPPTTSHHTSHHALHAPNSSHSPSISLDPIVLLSGDSSPASTLSMSLPQQATENPRPDEHEPISQVDSVSVAAVSHSDQSDASVPTQSLVSMDIISAVKEILRLKKENESLRRCLLAYNPNLLDNLKSCQTLKVSSPPVMEEKAVQTLPSSSVVLEIDDISPTTVADVPQKGHSYNPSLDSGITEELDLLCLSKPEDAIIIEQPRSGPHDNATPSCSSDANDKVHSPSSSSTPHPTSVSLAASSASHDKEVCPTRESHVPSPASPGPEAAGWPTPSSSNFRAGSESVPVDHVSPSTPSPFHEVSDVDTEAPASLTGETQQNPIPHNTPPCKSSHSTLKDYTITPTLSSGRTEIEKEPTEHMYPRISREEPERNSPVKVGTAVQLNQTHIAIMFHTTSSHMVCRLCLQKEPRVVFHVKTTSIFNHLEYHCKEEHPDMCRYLLGMTDDELSQMNHRLSTFTNHT